MVVTVIGPRDKHYRSYINTTSRAEGWSRGLSPFFVGPVAMPYGPTPSMLEHVRDRMSRAKSDDVRRQLSGILDGIMGRITAVNVENAWQYSKVYPEHDAGGEPSHEWYRWQHAGFRSPRASRYPMGKGVKPAYMWYDGKRLSYIEARRQVYIPMYSRAVRETTAYRQLEGLYLTGPLVLWDFDGYDHRALGMSFEDVVGCETRSLGHAFVLAMILEGVI
jgi:hypothetical protein